MGVSSTINRVALAGNGSSQTFGFPYYFFRQSDLVVYVYDTLLGGVTGPLVLNTDYTVSGTPNAQGLYQSGANVVFSTYVPLTTDIVLIIRNPIQQQNLSILYGQTIPSAALVQQMDYLTLLIQRLQDEVSRCIQVPDGTGVAFSGALPSDLALDPGTVPAVNSAGNGWTLASVAGTGTVQSVGLSLPLSVFNVSGSPVTGIGTLAAVFNNQAANLVFAGPASGAPGVPSFRALVASDVPGVGLTPLNGGDANYSIPSNASYVRTGTALTAQRLYTLPPATSPGDAIYVKHLKSQSFNLVLAGNGTDTIETAANVTMVPGTGILAVVGVAGQWDVF